MCESAAAQFLNFQKLNKMLTEEKILQAAESAKFKYENLDKLSFYRAATWANEQNAAEIASLRAVNTKLMQLFEVSKMILSADSESPDGLLDCQDNDGDYYQSAFLAAALSKMQVLVRQMAEAHVAPDPHTPPNF